MDHIGKVSKLSHSEIVNTEKEILANFWEFCQNNDLPMWLAYGTLIGAIRHQDMIPWDDDIDVVMLADDYKRMLAVLKETDGYISEHIRIVSPDIDANCPVTWAKVIDVRTVVDEEILVGQPQPEIHGLWVDIFPLYGVHQTSGIQKFAVAVFDVLYLLMRIGSWKRIPVSSGKGKLIQKVLTPLARIVSYQRSGKLAAWWMRKMFPATAKSNFVFSDSQSYLHFKRSLFERTQLGTFGDREYPIPAEYDELLTAGYGDYMTIPPESERVAHTMQAYRIVETKADE